METSQKKGVIMKSTENQAIGAANQVQPKDKKGFKENMKANWWRYLLGGIGLAAVLTVGCMLGANSDHITVPEPPLPID